MISIDEQNMDLHIPFLEFEKDLRRTLAMYIYWSVPEDGPTMRQGSDTCGSSVCATSMHPWTSEVMPTVHGQLGNDKPVG